MNKFKKYSLILLIHFNKMRTYKTTYTKHYYIEGERICSKIGGGFEWAHTPPTSPPIDFIVGDPYKCSIKLRDMVERNTHCAKYDGDMYIEPYLLPAHNNGNEYENLQYFYHSDHLGSASFVTNIDGYVMQHIQYLPYGELFVSQRNSEFDSRYKFTAKELDNETSYTYFGARYYDSELSGWLSVDPMSDKYPSLSPYCYSANNPVVLVDPNGMCIDEATDAVKSFFKGISNILSGRPWSARHNTNLVKRPKQKSEWAYLRSGGGMVTESYLNQLQSKVDRYKAGEENLAWAGRLMDRIKQDIFIDFKWGDPADYSQPHEETTSFYAPNVKISKTEFWSNHNYTPSLLNFNLSINNKTILNKMSYKYELNIKNGNRITTSLSRKQPEYGYEMNKSENLYYESIDGQMIYNINIKVIPDINYGIRIQFKRK
jgi:RHS repeat-associated protein